MLKDPAAECDHHLACGNGYCVAGKCVTCARDSHCGPCLVCAAHQCVQCALNDDCAGSAVCVQNHCAECRSDSDCAHGYRCSGNKCWRQEVRDGPCYSDSDCTSGHCIDSRCADCVYHSDCGSLHCCLRAAFAKLKTGLSLKQTEVLLMQNEDETCTEAEWERDIH
ncbi:endo-chitosanase C-like [Pollicipes pollicipes]|uniref:endo-chitosanase C-like n=1 Tax=Pollicipes pollicipes TaxID=41117 RepID=UPI0018855B26|nr:endo-chitosanase C-like [Pollicipes pollicipes]